MSFAFAYVRLTVLGTPCSRSEEESARFLEGDGDRFDVPVAAVGLKSDTSGISPFSPVSSLLYAFVVKSLVELIVLSQWWRRKS